MYVDNEKYNTSLKKIFSPTGKLIVDVSLKKVTHIKTNDTYYILYEGVLNCTNDVANKDILMVVYQNGVTGKVFVREENEFWKKFVLA